MKTSSEETSGQGYFIFALAGFLVPLLGPIVYFALYRRKPLIAGSAMRGAAWGGGVYLVLLAATIPPIFAKARDESSHRGCQIGLKRLGIAARQYVRNHGGRLPDLSSPDSIRSSLRPYTRASHPFVCQSTDQDYLVNLALSKKRLREVAHPMATVLFYEENAFHFGGRNVVYVDGHVKWLDEKGWLEAKRVSGIW